MRRKLNNKEEPENSKELHSKVRYHQDAKANPKPQVLNRLPLFVGILTLQRKQSPAVILRLVPWNFFASESRKGLSSDNASKLKEYNDPPSSAALLKQEKQHVPN